MRLNHCLIPKQKNESVHHIAALVAIGTCWHLVSNRDLLLGMVCITYWKRNKAAGFSPGWWSLSSLSRLKCCGGLPPQRHRVVAGRPHLTATCSHAMDCLANADGAVKWCQQRCSKKSMRYRNCHVQEHPQRPTWGSESFALSSGTNSVQSVTIHRFVDGLFIIYHWLSFAQHEICLLYSQCAWLPRVSGQGKWHRIMQLQCRSVLKGSYGDTNWAAPPKEPTQQTRPTRWKNHNHFAELRKQAMSK